MAHSTGTSGTLPRPSNWHYLIPALWRVEGSVLEDPGNGFHRKMQPEYRAKAATTSVSQNEKLHAWLCIYAR